MKKESINVSLLQGGNDSSRQIFQEHIRGQIQWAIVDLIQKEVEELCGRKYHPDSSSDCRRAGSEDGAIYIGGKRRRIVRARVRRMDEAGQEREVRLRSYEVARGMRTIEAEVADCMAHGMSTRSFERMGMQGASRATVSRRWVEHSMARIEQLRGRNLGEFQFFGLIIDGVFLTEELVVLVCIGLCLDGSKLVLDFVVGSSESYEVCHELLQRLQARGLKFAGRPLAIVDGAPALEKGLLEFWPQAHLQRCLVHKERNLHAHLRRKDHSECSRLMERLRRAQGPAAGREALSALEKFVAGRNQEALASLQEAGDRLITLHLLDAPATLNKALLSTNLIENLMRNYRRQTARVCRWRTEGNQVARWTAEALLWSEAGFRKISGYQDLPKLLKGLGFPATAGFPPPPLPGLQPATLLPKETLPARGAPASCHTPCSHPGLPEPVRVPASVLPQQEVGGKTDASTFPATA